MKECQVCNGTIAIKMPQINYVKLHDYEHFIEKASPPTKMKFLRKTIFNTKQMKQTLDLRKLDEFERSKCKKKWDKMPERIIKKKINMRYLKLKIKRRLIAAKNKGKIVNDQKCPVYLCEANFQTEQELISHYNSKHNDLV